MPSLTNFWPIVLAYAVLLAASLYLPNVVYKRFENGTLKKEFWTLAFVVNFFFCIFSILIGIYIIVEHVTFDYLVIHMLLVLSWGLWFGCIKLRHLYNHDAYNLHFDRQVENRPRTDL